MIPISDCFYERYGVKPSASGRAPGRVNLIGDHTDYADGFVLPSPLQCQTEVLLAANTPGAALALYSEQQADTLTKAQLTQAKTNSWIDYVIGSLQQLPEHQDALQDLRIYVRSNVPMGAAVSSSAALEVATLKAALAYLDLEMPMAELALKAQRAENAYVGMQCGIMDQMVCAAGTPHQALFLDCRSLESRLIALPQQAQIAVFHSGQARQLVAGAYNERRSAVEAAAARLGVQALRDATLEQVAQLSDPLVQQRARHVVSENQRVLDAIDALEASDFAIFGQLMTASHASLRDDYAVSTDALNHLQEACLAAGALGARLTGAGFGGCVVALFSAEQASKGIESVLGRQPESRLIQ